MTHACVTCGEDLSHRHGKAQFCSACARKRRLARQRVYNAQAYVRKKNNARANRNLERRSLLRKKRLEKMKTERPEDYAAWKAANARRRRVLRAKRAATNPDYAKLQSLKRKAYDSAPALGISPKELFAMWTKKDDDGG